MTKNTLHLLLPVAAALIAGPMAVSCGQNSAERLAQNLTDASGNLTMVSTVSSSANAISGALSAVAEKLPVDDMSICDRNIGAVSAVLLPLIPTDTIRANNPFEAHLDSMPPGGIKMKIRPLGASLSRVFNDSNKFHIAAAEANGITPLASPFEAWREGGKLQQLHTCEAYYLDNLTHSIPYLVPKAHTLLTDIGLAFRDSLRSRGGGDYRIKVTSVLRTPALVKKLRRRNRNAVDTSAHLYGTTFDISYLKFICDSTRVIRTQEDMKNLLGEVVEDMRAHGRCYVKYERQQSCYHITVR